MSNLNDCAETCGLVRNVRQQNVIGVSGELWQDNGFPNASSAKSNQFWCSTGRACSPQMTIVDDVPETMGGSWCWRSADFFWRWQFVTEMIFTTSFDWLASSDLLRCIWPDSRLTVTCNATRFWMLKSLAMTTTNPVSTNGSTINEMFYRTLEFSCLPDKVR